MSKADSDEPIRVMSESEFDEYLRRESAVSQRYAELGGRSVPAALDERILKQAREARAKPAAAPPPRWRLWGAPLAIAASALLAVTVLLRTTPEQRLAAPQRPASVEMRAAAPAPESPLVESDAASADVPAMEAAAPPAAASAEPAPSPRDRLYLQQPQPSAQPSGAGSAPLPEPKRAADGSGTEQAEPEHYQGGETRNYATYNPQVARDDTFLQGRREMNEAEAKAAEASRVQTERAQEAQERAEEQAKLDQQQQALPERSDFRRSLDNRARRTAAPPPPMAPPVATSAAPSREVFTAIQTVTSVLPPQPLDKIRQSVLEADRLTPAEQMLQQLRELRAQGKPEEAKALYRRLIEAHPDFQVSESDVPK